MKAIINRLTQHETLDREEAESILTGIAEGAYNPSQIAAFLTVFMMRSIRWRNSKASEKPSKSSAWP